MTNQTRSRRTMRWLWAPLAFSIAMPASVPVTYAQTGSRTNTPGNSSGFGDGALIPNANVGQGTPVRRAIGKYLLGPEDVISISVERFPDYGTRAAVIPPDGKLSLPYFGAPFNVNGKTAQQVEAELTRRLGTRIRNPRVSVGLVSIRSAATGYVYVVGSVRNPGTIEVYDGYRLTEILAKVGGTEKRLDEVKASLSRGGKLIPLDLYGAVSRPQTAANLRVRADDVITVQNVDPGRIAVNGDVTKPGVYELRRAPSATSYELPLQPRLLDVIVASGGLSQDEKPANGRMTGFVQRGSNRIDLRVEDAVTYRDPAANIALQPGDFVTFKMELPLNVNVLGEVRNPGGIQVTPGSGVLQAIAAAGGITREPAQVTATLLRNGQARPLELGGIINGEANANVPLQSGDIVRLDLPDTIKVSVTGSVGTPSSLERYALPIGSTVYDALARAGSVTIPDLTKARITIVRRQENGSQAFLSVNAKALLQDRDPSQNARLQDGDIVNVVQSETQTAVISGEVLKPGPFDLPEEGEDVATLLARAGGQRDTAALRRVVIKKRDGNVRTVDIYDAVNNGKPLGAEGKIEDGDYVVVPENLNRVFVTEAVVKPGLVPIPEGRPLTVLEAIATAGGTRPNARTQEVALVRQGANGPQVTRIPIDNLRRGNVAGANLTLQSGDVVVVPEGKVTTSTVQRVQSYLGILGFLNAFR